MNNLLTTSNPIGRRSIPAIRDHGEPLERVRRPDLDKAGVRRITSRVVGVRGGQPMLADGEVLHPSTVIWATGFERAYGWLDLTARVVDDDGWPLHEQGLSTRVPGLAFVGLPFQRSGTSALLGGVGRDARHVVRRLAHETATMTAGAEAPAERPSWVGLARAHRPRNARLRIQRRVNQRRDASSDSTGRRTTVNRSCSSAGEKLRALNMDRGPQNDDASSPPSAVRGYPST